MRLARVGLDRVVGQLAEPAATFTNHPDTTETSSRLTIEQFAELQGLEPDLQLIDVRSPAETAAGTLPGAREIPLAVLVDSLEGLDRHAAVVVYCASGYRSSVAASVLAAAGFDDVSDLLGGFAAWTGVGLPTSTGGLAVGRTPQVTARSAKARVDAGALLLDVREPDEWNAQHAPGAVLVPMGQIRARQGELPRDREVVVVCRSGGRSATITDSLRAWGFDAVNLAGGMCAWASAGLPVHTVEDHGLVVHRSEPLNCETSIPALIGGVVMPNARFYVRNHFPTPTLDPATWRLAVTGLARAPAATEPARTPEHALADRGGDARMCGQWSLVLRPADAGRTVAARRREHRGVDRRTARRGSRPCRAVAQRADRRAAWRRHRARRAIAGTGSLRARACRSTTPVGRTPSWPTR